MITPEVLSLAKKVWDYHHVNHTLVPSDCILTLGSHDTRVAERAAELYHQGWAPLLIFAGGLGRLTDGMWSEPEADLFARIAVEKGVPAEKILIENRSTNTGENIQLVKRLLKENGLDPQTFILVQKPYMERRTFATFAKNWPEKAFVVTSPQIAFADYPNEEISLEQVINIMVGDLQRIKVYPEKGFQVYQEIPGDVWQAFDRLVELGFDKQLI
jgi:uncharacterized SAM-binding protein YcdF (DUF218 family)